MYVEPSGYFPEEIRKEFKIGEYAENGDDSKEKSDEENQAFRDYVNEKE